MSVHLLVLSDADAKAALPALEFLDHTLQVGRLGADGLAELRLADVVLIDATEDLSGASQTCRLAAASDIARPILLVVAEGSLAAVRSSWGFDELVTPRAQPAEVEARLRLAVERGGSREELTRTATVGDLSIDEDTYVVRLRGHPLDLTYREFELLKYLAQQPGRAFTRTHLLSEVWGYDYYGGTRTVDVHIRRLRAKLGPEHEHLIGTIRGVGYKLVPEPAPGEEPTSSS